MKGRKTGRSLLRSERRAGLAFIAPMYFQFFVFFVFFMGYSLVMSMTDWNILANTKRFIGFLNFHEVLSDPLFWKSLWNTLDAGNPYRDGSGYDTCPGAKPKAAREDGFPRNHVFAGGFVFSGYRVALEMDL